ncbi:MAG: hypothetical protein OEU26_34425 [Candidatus Tectomicrobia bacterium]|nr:hypothetical protein [Candidatus Tectomicrobia bacterium]
MHVDSSRRAVYLWLGIVFHLGIAAMPFFRTASEVQSAPVSTPEWPQQFEGRPLIPLTLTAEERGFHRGFPGQVARFTDGSREIVMRWIHRPSRRLHPAADCLKAVGYQVTPKPIRMDAERRHWGCVSAQRQGKRLHVCERIYDAHGNSWSDVSSWYWAAILGKTSGPWWASTLAEASG